MKKFLSLFLISLVFLCSCEEIEKDSFEYLIGVSLANMRDPWRLVLIDELKEEASKHDNLRLIFTDAADDSQKQKKDIDKLLKYGIDLLIVSPFDGKKITPTVSYVHQKIPVIVLDREVEGYDYSLFIGPDNHIVGKKAAEAVIRLTEGKGQVLELYAEPLSLSSTKRHEGYSEIIEKFPDIKTTEVSAADDTRDAAEDIISTYDLSNTDIIFAHNDYMAFGAYKGIKNQGLLNKGIKIVGIDGFVTKDGGISLIKENKINETITCPIGGKEAIQFSLDILNEVSGVPKQVILRSHSIRKNNVEEYEESLYAEHSPYTERIKVGYAQVGTESGWRIANNNSIRDAAREEGIDLTVIDANQSKEKQEEAVRTFVDSQVDVIVISPIVGNDWDDALTYAYENEIPVLLSDRKIESNNEDLFLTFIGADFIEEGKRAMRWIEKNLPANNINSSVRILELQGTPGATPTIERKLGFETLLNESSGYKIIYSKSGDFTFEGGKEVLKNYLHTFGGDIDVVFSHNDDMALGAIEALEEYGLNPGDDVKIISIDGTKNAVSAIVDGKINCVVECSPLLGPQLMKAIKDLMSGKELPIRIITDEKVFTLENAKDELKNRTY